MQIFNAASYLTRFDAPDPIALDAENGFFQTTDVEEAEINSDVLPKDGREALRDEIRSELNEEFDRLLAQERAAAAARLAETRAQWVREESAALSQRLAEAIDLSVQKLRDDVTAVLTPFASQAVCALMLDDLVEILEDGLRNAGAGNVTVSGPSDLVNAARETLAQRNIHVAIEAGEGIDIVASSGSTTIRTQLGAWLDRICAAGECKK